VVLDVDGSFCTVTPACRVTGDKLSSIWSEGTVHYVM